MTDNLQKEQLQTSKEIWQMTKAEYEKTYGLTSGSTVTRGYSPHRSAVEIALNRGFNVPAEVLADYPSLKDI